MFPYARAADALAYVEVGSDDMTPTPSALHRFNSLQSSFPILFLYLIYNCSAEYPAARKR